MSQEKQDDIEGNLNVLQKSLECVQGAVDKVKVLTDDLTYWEMENKTRRMLSKLCVQLAQSRDFSTKLLKHLQKTQITLDDELDTMRRAGRDQVDIDSRPLELTPEEQELAYELKAQMMRNINTHCSNLRAEMALHKRLLDYEGTYQLPVKNKQTLHSELSRSNALKLMRMFERKAKEANVKYEAMQKELTKAKEMATKFQELHEAEKAKNAGEASPDTSPRALEGASQPATSAKHKTTERSQGWNVHDVIRRNENMLAENEKLRLELRSLRKDTAELMGKSKRAQEDRDMALHHLYACESSRQDLQKRLEREQKRHAALQNSFNRQASDWIRGRQKSNSAQAKNSTARLLSPMPSTEFERHLLSTMANYGTNPLPTSAGQRPKTSPATGRH